MKIFIKIPIILAIVAVMISCRDSESELRSEILSNVEAAESNQISSGSADFSNYVAVGNSITAGFMDAALYDAGQANSYPSMIANQMLPAGGGGFSQPDINSANGLNFTVSDIANNVLFGRFVLDASIPGPVPLSASEADLISILTPFTDSHNNFGIPGARVVDLVSPLYGTPDVDMDGFPEGNPFYHRIASAPGTSTVLGDAAAAGPTFVSLWIGQNDLLGYLTSGGTSEDVTDNPAAIANPSSLTDVANFTAALDGVAATLTVGGTSGGVISNLTDATLAPFFRAVPYNAVPLTDQQATDAMAQIFTGFNAAVDGLQLATLIDDAEDRKVNYSAGANPILIVDSELQDISAELGAISPLLSIFGQARPLKGNELVLLSAATVIGAEITPPGFPAALATGITYPMGDEYTLTVDELALHQSRLTAFNGVIATTAATYNMATVDAYTIFLSLALNGGTVEGGQTLLPDFSPNGVFSTDGLHPNPRGSAIIANAFIDAINAQYGSNLQSLDVISFPGISLL